MAFSWVILLIWSSGTFGRARPHRVAVRVVGLPCHVVDADALAHGHADWIADEAGEEVLAEDLAG